MPSSGIFVAYSPNSSSRVGQLCSSPVLGFLVREVGIYYHCLLALALDHLLQVARAMAQLAAPSFLLVALNQAAHDAVRARQNKHHACHLGTGELAFNITLSDEVHSITLGSGSTADIYLPDRKGAEISKVQCSFSAARGTGAVVLRDASRKQNTDVYDQDDYQSIPISKVSHSIVVSAGFNRKIGFGHKRYYDFELRWVADELGKDFSTTRGPVLGPIESPVARYIRGREIGAGAFGVVFRAVNLENGEPMAVKRFHQTDGRSKIYARREVANLKKINRDAANVR